MKNFEVVIIMMFMAVFVALLYFQSVEIKKLRGDIEINSKKIKVMIDRFWVE